MYVHMYNLSSLICYPFYPLNITKLKLSFYGNKVHMYIHVYCLKIATEKTAQIHTKGILTHLMNDECYRAFT